MASHERIQLEELPVRAHHQARAQTLPGTRWLGCVITVKHELVGTGWPPWFSLTDLRMMKLTCLESLHTLDLHSNTNPFYVRS